MKYVKVSLVLITIVFIFFFVFNSTEKNIFSVEGWNSNIWNRENMIQDLTNKYDFYDMTDEDIIELLGKEGLVEGSHYSYYIGKSYLGPILFNISFYENGYVKSYGIVID